MHTYPANERRISDVETGRSCEAIVAAPPGQAPAPGDAVLFALVQSRSGRPADYVKGGDSVLVSLTGVFDLDETDPATGHPLIRLCWTRLGQSGPSVAPPGRAGRSPRLR